MALGPAGAVEGGAVADVIPLGGDWRQVSGPFVFNANGIEASRNGKTLVIVNQRDIHALHGRSGRRDCRADRP